MNAPRQTNQPQGSPAPTERKVQPYLRLIKPGEIGLDGLTPAQRAERLYMYFLRDLAARAGGQLK